MISSSWHSLCANNGACDDDLDVVDDGDFDDDDDNNENDDDEDDVCPKQLITLVSPITRPEASTHTHNKL